MSAVSNIRAAAPALPDVVGYVEAATVDRILGWAWSPSTPEVRVSVELRLGGTIVTETVADLLRADLASSGVGDGRHAYEIAIPPEVRDNAAELRVFARAGDGKAMPIGAPPAAEDLSDQVTKVLRGVDTLLNSQRMIHRNLQAALTAKAAGADPDDEPTANVLARLTDLQAGTAEQLSAVERFVVRLDDQLAKLSLGAGKLAPEHTRFPQAALWALGVSGTALVVSVVGLVRSLGG